MRAFLTILCALLAVSCQRNKIRAILPPGARIDVYPQVTRAQLDALFVVDNGRYMDVHEKRVADSFHRFVEYLARNQIDWHLGLVASDVTAQPGVYRGGGDKKYFASTDSNPAQAVAQAVITLGSGGNPLAAVLQQADLALRGPPDGFLRPGAALFVVLVTDDDDPWSPGEDLYYYRALKQAKGAGNDGLARLAAVAGPPPSGCTLPDPANPQNTFFAQPAPRLQGLSLQTGGGFHSLCDPDFDAVFDDLGATGAGMKRAFRLAKVPDLASLVVTVRAPCDVSRAALVSCSQVSDECGEPVPGLACTPGPGSWNFEEATNSVVFSRAAIPPRGSQVEIQYKERAP
jgi:hypothetical protein